MALLLGGGSASAGVGSSSLSWDQTTQGVTLEGLNDLLEQIKVVMVEDAIDNLDNTQAVKEAVAEGWQGGDRDLWIQHFDELKDEIKGSLEFYYNQIETEFQKIFTSWEEFQSSNVT